MIWVSRKRCVHRSDQVRHSAESCMVWYLLPLLRRGRSYSLNEPNSIGIFTNVELLPTPLKCVISDGEANQTILKSILRAIQVFFNVCITHALALLIPSSHLTKLASSPSPHTGVHRNDIRMSCGYGPNRFLCPVPQRRYKRFPTLKYGWRACDTGEQGDYCC